MNELLVTRRETVSGTFSSRKQRDSSTDPAVQNMLGEISSSELLAAGHGGSSPKPSQAVKTSLSTIFFAVRRVLDKA